MAILVPANVGADDALHPPIGQLVAQLVPHLHPPLPPILVLRRRARTIALVAGLENGRIKPAPRHFEERWIHLGPVFLVIPLDTAFALVDKKIMNFHRRENDWPNLGQWKLELLPEQSPAHNKFSKCAFNSDAAVGMPKIEVVFGRLKFCFLLGVRRHHETAKRICRIASQPQFVLNEKFFHRVQLSAKPGLGGLFLYDRSGVVPAEYRVEEGAGESVGNDAVARMLAGAGKSPKRMKDLETALTKSLETCFAMAEERGLFAGDAKSRTVNDIVEDIKMTKKQMADLKAMEEDSIFSDDSDEEDSDGDSDGEGVKTYELAIASLKKRLKELKSELKNHSK